MAYIGRQLTAGNYLKLDDISSQFDGSTTQFNLTSGGSAFYPGSPFSILVSLAGIIQEPDSAYQIDQSTITFATAPQASDDFFCIALGVALAIGVPGDQTVSGTKLSKPFNYDNGLLYLDDTNNYVGINTTSPGFDLEVGAVGASGTSLRINGEALTDTLRVGSATTFTEDLVVTGNARITGILTIGTASITLDANAGTIAGLQEIVLGEVGAADTVRIRRGNGGRIEFTDRDGTEATVGIGTTVSINTTGIITASTVNAGVGITLSATQINVGSATTIHSSGFLIGGSNLHSTGIELTNINATGIITASSFSGDGSSLTGITAGATLSDSSGSQRVVLTGQTSGTMTGAATTSTLTFDSSTNVLSVNGNTVWHAGNDGSGSGLDASNVNASADQAIVNQHDGNSSQWYGRILSKNSTNNRASFLGTYGSIAGVFAHNNALNAWADLYVNTVNGTDGGAVILSNSTFASNGDATIKQLVIGGNYSNNAYSSVSSTRLMFGGGDSDAQGNYFIGTNMENYGGNYTKLDLRWHTGIRMGAQAQYGGLRIFDSEDLGSLLFQVNGGSNYLYKYQWLYTNGGTGMYSDTNGAHISPNNGSYGSWRIDGSRNGWYGIESTNTAVTLMMNTDTYGFHYNGVGWRLYNSGGSIYCPGDIVAYWSDIRLKENIEILPSGTGVEIINKLKPSKFNWKESAKEYNDTIKAGKEEIGLIAQEVQEVIPDAVIQNKSGVPAHGRGEAYYTINYNKITPYLVQAIKDLTEKVNQLETEIKKLKEN